MVVRWINEFKRNINKTETAARCPGSGCRQTVRTVTVNNINDVDVLSQNDNFKTHRIQRQISRELCISKPSVNLRLKCIKKRKEDLRQRIMQVWDEFDQGIIDVSDKQWRRRLRGVCCSKWQTV